MNWIDFYQQLPEEGQLILLWNRQEAYMGETKVMDMMDAAPHVTRFSKEELDDSQERGKKAAISCRGIDMYSSMECWVPIPELDKEYTKDDFQLTEEQLQQVAIKERI